MQACNYLNATGKGACPFVEELGDCMPISLFHSLPSEHHLRRSPRMRQAFFVRIEVVRYVVWKGEEWFRNLSQQFPTHFGMSFFDFIGKYGTSRMYCEPDFAIVFAYMTGADTLRILRRGKAEQDGDDPVDQEPVFVVEDISIPSTITGPITGNETAFVIGIAFINHNHWIPFFEARDSRITSSTLTGNFDDWNSRFLVDEKNDTDSVEASTETWEEEDDERSSQDGDLGTVTPNIRVLTRPPKMVRPIVGHSNHRSDTSTIVIQPDLPRVSAMVTRGMITNPAVKTTLYM